MTSIGAAVAVRRLLLKGLKVLEGLEALEAFLGEDLVVAMMAECYS